MRLSAWLSMNDVTQHAFAELIGSSQPQVARFAAGTRIPNKETMRRIVEVTQGAIDPRDFYDAASVGPGEAARIEADD